MTENVRRVVTGHDKDGKAIVLIDDIATNIAKRRWGQAGATIWSSDSFPVDNNDAKDGGLKTGGVAKGETCFRITTFSPGVPPRRHRTRSFEYGVVLKGEIEMILEGSSVHLKAGDCFVQRGTFHDWANHGPEDCVVAMISMEALPVKVGDTVLEPVG